MSIERTIKVYYVYYDCNAIIILNYTYKVMNLGYDIREHVDKPYVSILFDLKNIVPVDVDLQCLHL